MIVLVPSHVHEELVPAARAVAPNAELMPYAEEGAVPDAGRAEAVYRWIDGRRYARLAVEEGPNVRWLHTASAGVDHVITPGIAEKVNAGNLVLTDSGPAFGIAIGEFVLGWMLAVTRRLPEMWEQQRTKTWGWVTGQRELYGQTVGVIGVGPVGLGIAERCRAMGMRTLGLRRRPESVPGVDETLTGPEGLNRLLAESDWVVVAAALTGETRSLLGAPELARMKPTGRVVNVARGALIDEAALTDALRSDRIAGACLDVFVQEPLPANSPLWSLENVFISPHSSAWTTGLRERQKRLFLENLARYAHGQPLYGIVDVARGY